MGKGALIFDISTKRMKEDGLTDSEINRVYNTIARELRQAGIDERIQHSVYRSTNSDGINAMLALLANKERFPLFCQYKERVHLMGCDEFSDATAAVDTQKALDIRRIN